MSGATNRNGDGEIIVTEDFDEVHFTGDEVQAMGQRDYEPRKSDHDPKHFGMDVAGAFSTYDAAQKAFMDRYPGFRPEAFSDGGASLDQRNPLRIEVVRVLQAMSPLVDTIVEGIVDGRDVTAAMAVVENTVRFPGMGTIGNDQTFRYVMRSVIGRLEAEVRAKGGDLGGLRASHEAVEIRTDLWGKLMSAIKSLAKRLSPEQELDAMKSWIGVLAEGVGDLRVRHAIEAAEKEPEGVPNFGIGEMAAATVEGMDA